MIHKTPSKCTGYVYIVFELPSCLWADQISVTGDFNNWDRNNLPMKQGRDGVWRACMELPAGKVYAFRYLVDGRWQTDHQADGTSDNGYGSHNSLIDLTMSMPFTVEHRLSGQVPESYAHALLRFAPGEESQQAEPPPVHRRTERVHIRARAAAA